MGAPGSAVAYIAAAAGPGQHVQWQAQLAKVHQSVQHLPMDREVRLLPQAMVIVVSQLTMVIRSRVLWHDLLMGTLGTQRNLSADPLNK